MKEGKTSLSPPYSSLRECSDTYSQPYCSPLRPHKQLITQVSPRLLEIPPLIAELSSLRLWLTARRSARIELEWCTCYDSHVLDEKSLTVSRNLPLSPLRKVHLTNILRRTGLLERLVELWS